MYEITYAVGRSVHDERHMTVKVRADILASRISNLQKQSKRIVRVREVKG